MEKLIAWFANFIYKWNKRRLRNKVALLQSNLENQGSWTLSFELCHMILTTIGDSYFDDLTRSEVDSFTVTLWSYDIDKILQHLGEVVTHLETIALNNSSASRGFNGEPLPSINTRKYSDEVGEYSLGKLISLSKEINTTKILYHRILKDTHRICEILYTEKISEVKMGYVDRMSKKVLEDTFELTTALTSLAVGEETNE